LLVLLLDAAGCLFCNLRRGRECEAVLVEAFDDLGEHGLDLLEERAGVGGLRDRLEELVGLDVERLGDAPQVGDAWGAAAAFPVAVVADVDADEFCGLDLGERRVVVLAEAFEVCGDVVAGSHG
jgi:hypothetical protein